MQYNKIQTMIQEFIDKNSTVQSVDWNKYRQLEKIYKMNFISSELSDRADYLHKWMHNINLRVYKSKRSFNYCLVKEFEILDFLNRNLFETSDEIVLTEELFDELCESYIEFQINRLIEELTEKELTRNSTVPIENIVFSWQLECKQEMLKMYKQMLKK